MEISTIIEKEIIEDKDELGNRSGDVLLHAEGHLDTPGGVKYTDPTVGGGVKEKGTKDV